LGKYAVLIKGHEAAEAGVSASAKMIFVGRFPSITRKWYLKSASSARNFVGRLAECQPLGLREQIRHQEIVMLRYWLSAAP
jgi:hypothetical protein